MLNSILNFIIKKPTWSLIAFLIIVCSSVLQIQNFSLDASSESLSLDGDNNLELYFATQETFGSDESLVISYSVKDGTILSKDQILFQSPPLSLVELASEVYTIDNGKADQSLISKEFKNSPLYSNNLVSADLKTTALLIPLANDDPRIIIDDEVLRLLIEKIRLTMDAYRDEATLYLGGVPMIRNDVIDFIKSDLVVFSLAVILTMTIMLTILFRKIRWVLIPITISVIGALFMTGLISSIGWKVTVISSNFFSLLLVMTLSVIIHLVVRYREISNQNLDQNNSETIRQTLNQMTKKSFALEKLALVADKKGKSIILSCTVIALISTFGLSKLSVENSFINYFKKDTEIYQGLNFIDKELGGTIPLEIVFNDLASAYWADASLREDFHGIHNYLEQIPSIGKVLSIDTFMQVLKEANNGKTPNGFLLTLGKNNMPDFAKSQVLKPHISDVTDQIRIVARVKETMNGLERNQLILDIKKSLVENFYFDEGDFYFTGTFSLYNNLLQSLFSSQIKTIFTVFSIIFVLFVIVFRSISVALIAVIPNTLPSLIILGLMGLMGIPLDIMTITIAAIAIGIGIDNAIHYISRFKTELLVDGDFVSSMYRAHNSIGVSMFYTAATVAIGFVVLILSHFIPSIYFGIFMAIAMLSAVIVNLTLLPKLLITFKPRMNKKVL